MKTKLSLLVTALLFVYQVNAQNILTVDNSEGANAQYNSLQSAISSASVGDIIHVHPSITNYGEIVINKQLTLIGFGHSDPDKRTYVTDINFSTNSSNSNVSGLHITRNLYSTSDDRLSGLIIENNYIAAAITFTNGGVEDTIIRGNVLYAIGSSNYNSYNNYIDTIISNNVITGYLYVYNHDSVTIKNNIFSNNTATPIYNRNNTTGSLIVQNNLIYRDYYRALDINTTGLVFQNCLAYNRGGGNMTDLNGTNNLNNQNPLFVEDNEDAAFSSTDDYHLQAGSPAIGAGVDGEDIGLYDSSPFIFNNNGYSNGIPTVKITNITDRISTGANLSVTINTNAN